MKCPKCGYNSFEYKDTCKKCSNDLTAYKATYGLKAIVLPLEARTAMAEAVMTETATVDHTPEAAETTSDMFSFDLPEGESGASTAAEIANDNPFNFDDEPEATQPQDAAEFAFDEPEAAQPQSFGDFSFDDAAATKDADEPALDESASTQPQDFGDFAFDEPAATQPQTSGEFPGAEDPKSAQAKAEEDAFASLLESSSHDENAAGAASAPENAATGGAGELDLENFSWDDTPAAPAEAGTKPDDDFNNLFGDPADVTKK